MIILKKYQIINFKHLRPNDVFLLAPKMMGRAHFSRAISMVGRQTPVLRHQFNEESTFYLAPGILGRWRQWGKLAVSQLVWAPL
jgi:hypothetical protein